MEFFVADFDGEPRLMLCGDVGGLGGGVSHYFSGLATEADMIGTGHTVESMTAELATKPAPE